MRKNGKNPSTDDCLLKQYLEASPHCVELFTIWDDMHGVCESARGVMFCRTTTNSASRPCLTRLRK